VEKFLNDRTSAMTLPKACAFLGERTGKTPATSTAWRWVLRGVRGGIKLEVFRIGGITYTTPEMIERFIARTSGTAPQPSTPNARADLQAVAVDHDARRREIATAQSRLHELCTPKTGRRPRQPRGTAARGR
jgi:hypothetical protein